MKIGNKIGLFKIICSLAVLAVLTALSLNGCGNAGVTKYTESGTDSSVASAGLKITTAGNVTYVKKNTYLQLTAIEDGTNIDRTSLATWESSDTSYATVSATGLVKGIKGGGSAIIKATYGTLDGSIKLTTTGAPY